MRLQQCRECLAVPIRVVENRQQDFLQVGYVCKTFQPLSAVQRVCDAPPLLPALVCLWGGENKRKISIGKILPHAYGLRSRDNNRINTNFQCCRCCEHAQGCTQQWTILWYVAVGKGPQKQKKTELRNVKTRKAGLPLYPPQKKDGSTRALMIEEGSYNLISTSSRFVSPGPTHP